MKRLTHLVRITLLAALLAATALSSTPVTQARAEGAVITVTTEAFEYDVLAGNGFCSLGEAMVNARQNSAAQYDDCAAGSSTASDTIVFHDDVHHIYLTDFLPAITDPTGLTINGGGDVTLDGQSAQRILTVGPNGSLKLDSLTLVNGYVGPNYGGGAIWNDGGDLTVTGSVFYNNQAGFGGAIFNGGSGHLEVINSLFPSNSATNGGGGAVLTEGGNILLRSNTFRWNSATAGGGDLYIVSGVPSPGLWNNLFAESNGGGHCRLEASAPVAGYYNLFQDATHTCGFTQGVNGNLVGVDPQFDPNDWRWFALKSTSPAIDAGTNTFCPYTLSWSGYVRPQGLRCDIGAFEYPQTFVLQSFPATAAEDGWVLESGETTGVGGTKNNTAATLRIGDDASNKQYRAILSFDTEALPEDAAIVYASLAFKDAGKSGTNPFNMSNNVLLGDVISGSFGTKPALQLGDFQAAGSQKGVLGFTKANLTNGWYATSLHFSLINRSGLTQVRLRFTEPDNNNLRADYLKIISANGDPGSAPFLLIKYYVR